MGVWGKAAIWCLLGNVATLQLVKMVYSLLHYAWSRLRIILEFICIFKMILHITFPMKCRYATDYTALHSCNTMKLGFCLCSVMHFRLIPRHCWCLLLLFQAHKYMIDFRSTHFTPLPANMFRLTWELSSELEYVRIWIRHRSVNIMIFVTKCVSNMKTIDIS
jgi:hypothetical protein